MSNKIDWGRFAALNGLTIDEFNKEILVAASAVGATMIDEEPDIGAIRFKCSDDTSKIMLTVRRLSDA